MFSISSKFLFSMVCMVKGNQFIISITAEQNRTEQNRYKGKLEKDPAELVQNKFLKWLLGVNKYCNNNACRAETGRFPMTIAAQCRNFKFRLTLTTHEYKLSQIAYNDIKWQENKAFWSKKIKSLLEQIGNLWMKASFLPFF